MFTDVMAQNLGSFKTNLVNEPIPESPRQSSPEKFPPSRTQTPKVAPGPNPDKGVDVEETKTKLTPANPTSSAAVNGNGTRPAATTGLNGARQINDKAKPTSTTANNSKSTPRTAPISTSTKTTTKPLKSPGIAKAPKSTVKEAAKAVSSIPKKHTTAAPKDETMKKPVAPKSSIPSTKKPAPLNLAPSSTGFVKPKPKSPTRPVKLPERLTTHTAASASRLGVANVPAPRQTLSRASGNVQSLGIPNGTSRRPTSRASVSAVSTATAPRNLRRQSSTINRPRPSIGPPPKPTARDHPIVRKESPVDDGILARLMRPTTSSSSKTAEKTPVTPPRKQSVPTFVKTPASQSSEGSAKKAAAKMAESVKPNDNHVVNKPAVPKSTTPSTPKQISTPSRTTAKEIAPVVAQAETAEEAIQVATASKDTATTPIMEEPETSAAEEAIAASVPVAAAAPASKEPVVVKEPELVVKPTETVKETPEVVVDASEPVEEAPKPAADTPELVKEVSLSNGHGPVVSDDPEKLEDIEDVIQQGDETPVAEDKAEASVSKDEESLEEKSKPEEVDVTESA